MSEPATPLPHDHSLDDVAAALGMSTRWIRDRIKAGNEGKASHVEHIRRGHKIRFTTEQVEKLRADGTQAKPVQPVTTGRKKS